MEHLTLEQALGALQGWLGEDVEVHVGAASPGRPYEWGDPERVALVIGQLIRAEELVEDNNPYAEEGYQFLVGAPPQGFTIHREAFTGAHLLREGVLAVMLDKLRLMVVRVE